MGDAYAPNEPAPLNKASLGQAVITSKAAEEVWVAVPEGTSTTGAVASLGALEPTQVRRPWRAVVRTVFQFVVAFAILLPFIVQASGLDPEVYPWLGGALAIAAGLTRVMALPQVEAFLRRFLPFLSAAPK